MMDMTTERPTAVHALHDGDLAYFDAIVGLIPVKVLCAGVGNDVQVRVTADRGPFRKGQLESVPGRHLVHRDSVWRKHSAGGPRILGQTVYMGAR